MAIPEEGILFQIFFENDKTYETDSKLDRAPRGVSERRETGVVG